MKVNVTRLCKRGVRVRRPDAEPAVVGTLGLHYLEARKVATLIDNPAMPKSLIPDLLYPELVDLGSGRLRLRGFEEVDGVLYGQDWLCEVLK